MLHTNQPYLKGNWTVVNITDHQDGKSSTIESVTSHQDKPGTHHDKS